MDTFTALVAVAEVLQRDGQKAKAESRLLLDEAIELYQWKLGHGAG